MTCVSPDARITPGCLGLWNDEQAQAWKRIVDFVHRQTPAKIGIQLGHAGRKGSTQACLGRHRPAADERRLAADLGLGHALSARIRQVPRAMTREDMDRVTADFVAARRRARRDSASTFSSCTAPTATCCRASSRR